jgi:hypothetical protein
MTPIDRKSSEKESPSQDPRERSGLRFSAESDSDPREDQQI